MLVCSTLEPVVSAKLKVSGFLWWQVSAECMPQAFAGSHTVCSTHRTRSLECTWGFSKRVEKRKSSWQPLSWTKSAVSVRETRARLYGPIRARARLFAFRRITYTQTFLLRGRKLGISRKLIRDESNGYVHENGRRVGESIVVSFSLDSFSTPKMVADKLVPELWHEDQ